jgi:murein DD-endopeptidase MepM/ murein hydrolase activator NlpD
MAGPLQSPRRASIAAIALSASLVAGCGSSPGDVALESDETILVDIKPVDDGRLSSRFGWRRWHPILKRPAFHAGIDWAAPSGTPVRAAADGRVVQARSSYGGYGTYLKLDHGGRIETAYAHLSSMQVRRGARVRRGEVIGRVGRTGRATGPHLHFELRLAGRAIDPLKAASYAMAPPIGTGWPTP